MAKAKITKKTVEVSLTLNEHEAKALADILYRIGGDPETTRRGLADDIAAALDEVKFTPSIHEDDVTGSIDFH